LVFGAPNARAEIRTGEADEAGIPRSWRRGTSQSNA
jgi:hypothetical protein